TFGSGAYVDWALAAKDVNVPAAMSDASVRMVISCVSFGTGIRRAMPIGHHPFVSVASSMSGRCEAPGTVIERPDAHDQEAEDGVGNSSARYQRTYHHEAGFRLMGGRRRWVVVRVGTSGRRRVARHHAARARAGNQ